jgi:hypothetical protein
MSFQKVKENKDLIKNPNTNIVINTNKANYIARRAKKSREKMKDQEIQNLRSELDEMKNLVQQLLKEK